MCLSFSPIPIPFCCVPLAASAQRQNSCEHSIHQALHDHRYIYQVSTDLAPCPVCVLLLQAPLLLPTTCMRTGRCPAAAPSHTPGALLHMRCYNNMYSTLGLMLRWHHVASCGILCCCSYSTLFLEPFLQLLWLYLTYVGVYCCTQLGVCAM
jgi:hypothetical protein